MNKVSFAAVFRKFSSTALFVVSLIFQLYMKSLAGNTKFELLLSNSVESVKQN